MDSKPVLDWMAGLSADQAVRERPLKELPAPSKNSDWREIAEYLFDQGVGSSAIQHLTDRIDELIRIARWYRRAAGPFEAETIAYVVIPPLRALGWAPQKMAVEWLGVDVALFGPIPRRDENLVAVVEVKPMNRSCLTARSQAQAYAEQPARKSCTRLIVTDGLRYGVYLRQDGKFRDRSDAYLNLAWMRDEYPVLGCRGAKDALLLMSPDWVF